MSSIAPNDRSDTSPEYTPKAASMKLLVSGGSGLVGTALRRQMSSDSCQITTLTRSAGSEDSIHWSPEQGLLPLDQMTGFDAVVHLAGDNIADGRWTAAKKARIRDSRVNGTTLLSKALAELEIKPKVLVSASAIGFYGNRGDEKLVEEASNGSTYLAEVCREWEAATQPAKDAGIRVINLRFGIILSPKGGALKNMLLPFRFGAGGRVGNGRQYWSWISLADAVGSIEHSISHAELVGPVNAVAPEPATNLEFTKALGGVLKRPTIFPMPAVAAKMALGEMADALLLSSARVYPQKLQATGYTFQHPNLAIALQSLLG